MDAPSIQVRPSSNSARLFERTAFMLEAINDIDELRANIVEPARRSDILYLSLL